MYRRVRYPRMCVCSILLAVFAVEVTPSAAGQDSTSRLPEGVHPVIGAWFWPADCFEPDGYKQYVDLFRDHTAYDLLPVSFRLPNHEVTDPGTHDQVKKAVAYARQNGMRVALDLDIRLAREAFRKAYPDEQQEMLRLRTIDLADTGEVTLSIASEVLTDHMTGGTTPYIPLSGRFVRAYAYAKGPQGVDPATVVDITDVLCAVQAATDKEVRVAIQCSAKTAGRQACIMVAFTHFTPDVFAPHLLSFQRDIVKQYADAGLSGIMKDEWGFPPCHGGCPEKNDFWYSEAYAKAYGEKTGGRDLLRDCLLMHLGEQGREKERQACINQFQELSLFRNAEIEDDYYKVAKETFGPNAYVVTHATWVPYPGPSEFKKNGLDWWKATRDLGQSDEFTPLCARTSLAKKWGSGVWYNQFYSKQLGDYEQSLWTHALAGGRINYHPLYPYEGEKYRDMLRGGLMRGDCRLRLLNLISKSPADCPVAVIFGHFCAMNWAGGAYDDVGLQITDRLWREGFFADLIPSTEIGCNALKVDEDGYVQYGAQPYAAVVLYHPEFDRASTAAFFEQAARGKTTLYRVGDWNCDFDAKPFDGNAALPASMLVAADGPACAEQIIARLRELNVEPNTPANGSLRPEAPEPGYAAPNRKGTLRLIDGTRIVLAGENDVTGDPIQTDFIVDGRTVHIDAVGVAAVRLTKEGALDALAAGGLKRLQMPGLDIVLAEPVDVALWRDKDGVMHGALQGWNGPVPELLAPLANDWLRLSLPAPLP